MKRKKHFIVLAVLALAVMLAGCSEPVLMMVTGGDNSVTISAEGAEADQTEASGSFQVADGQEVQIESKLDEGKILVQFYSSDAVDADNEPTGDPSYEMEVSGTETMNGEIGSGEFVVRATIKEQATGEVVITAVSKEEGQERSEEPAANTDESTDDGWTIVDTAAEAAMNAGNMDEFEVPSQLKINDMTFTDPVFSYQDGVAQAYYESGAVGISIRKAGGIYGGPITDRDIDSFPEHWKQQVGDDADDVVDCYGMEKGSAIVAQWGDEDEFYSVTSQGLGGEEYGMDDVTVERLEDVID